jgi:hypothetical protein
MRTMAVVVIDVGVQDAFELATAGDQDPVEALALHGRDEALGKRVRLAEARNVRSAERSAGRATWRRRIASS